MDVLTMFHKIVLWEDSLASAAIEGNNIASKHLKILEDIDSIKEKYMYLKFVFDEFENKYNKYKVVIE